MGSPHVALFRSIALRNINLRSRIVMGSMHTGLESHPERFAELARFYADRARGGAGLIVTGGFAPNFAGRMKDEPGTFERADQVPAHRTITAGRARRRRTHPAADPACRPVRLPPCGRRAVPDQVAHQPRRAGRPVGGRDRRDGLELRRHGGPGARGGLRRRRGDGLRGLPHQPVPRAAHQSPRRRLGWPAGEPRALPPGGRACRAQPPWATISSCPIGSRRWS